MRSLAHTTAAANTSAAPTANIRIKRLSTKRLLANHFDRQRAYHFATNLTEEVRRNASLPAFDAMHTDSERDAQDPQLRSIPKNARVFPSLDFTARRRIRLPILPPICAPKPRPIEDPPRLQFP